MLANGLQSLAQRLLRGLDAQRPSAQLKPQCVDADRKLRHFFG